MNGIVFYIIISFVSLFINISITSILIEEYRIYCELQNKKESNVFNFFEWTVGILVIPIVPFTLLFNICFLYRIKHKIRDIKQKKLEEEAEIAFAAQLEIKKQKRQEESTRKKFPVEYSEDGKTLIKVPSIYKGTFEIPNSVEIIGELAFEECIGLTYIEIPNTVIEIGDRAFRLCTGLSHIEIPNSVKKIGLAAFGGCTGLTSIEIPESVTEITDNYYLGKGQFEIIGPFVGCTNLKSIIVAKGNTKFNSGDNSNALIYSGDILSGCQNSTIPNNIVSICSNAFRGCMGLKDIRIPNSVKYIGLYAFEECTSLTNIKIPESVHTIGEDAFRGCTNLKSISLPKSLDDIYCPGLFQCGAYGIYNFLRDCPSLESIIVANGNPRFNSQNNCNALLWGNSLISGCQNTKIPNSVTHISNYAFAGCSNLKNIEIPNSVRTISDHAFKDCQNLTSIRIPSSTNEIGIIYQWDREAEQEYIFSGCLNISSIIVDKENPVYDSRGNCNAIIHTKSNTLITGCYNTIIPHSIIRIGSNAFLGCSRLKNLVIPNSVKYIKSEAFKDCTELTDITLSNSLEEIGSCAFVNCTSLTSIFIPDSVKKIGFGAFEGCTELINITIPESLEEFGGQAFKGCTRLRTVHIKTSNTNIISRMFSETNLSNVTFYVPIGTGYAYRHDEILSKCKDVIIEK